MFRFFVVLFSGLVVCAVSTKATEINKKEVPNWNIFTEEGRDYVWGRAKYNFSETCHKQKCRRSRTKSDILFIFIVTEWLGVCQRFMVRKCLYYRNF